MYPIKLSRNIPKERVFLNQSALNGIEYSLTQICRDSSFNESYTTVIGKGILSEQEINEMGKAFYRISHRDMGKAFPNVNRLTILPSDIIPVILQFIKYLQHAGYEYQGHIEEQKKVNNQINLALNLLKGLDPAFRIYHFANSLINATYTYYFDNYEIYE